MERIKFNQNGLIEIKDILEKNSECKIDIHYDSLKEALWYRCKNETELYICSYYPKNLVIKRIQLLKTGIGDGRKIINLLTKYGMANGFDNLIVECVSSKSMDALCNKLSFLPDVNNGIYMDNMFWGNYILPLRNIKE